MSLMCSIAACKAKAGMRTHEKVTAGGARGAVDGPSGGIEGRRATGRRVGGPRRGGALAVPRVWHRAGALRPRRGTRVAASGQLPVPDVPARAAPAGGVPDPWSPASPAAVGRGAGPLHDPL